MVEGYLAFRYFLFRVGSQFSRSNESMYQERRFLRKMLRWYPPWIRGHLRLGQVELAIESASATTRNRRAIGAIRVSATVALRLVRDGSHAVSTRESVRLECVFLLAAAHFLAREFEQALRLFREVLAEEHAKHVTHSLGLSAMEYAGIASMAVGKGQDAFRYFSRIPENERSTEVRSGLAHLARSVDG